MSKEGVNALYKGAGSNILRGLCGALVLVGFDYCQDMYIDAKVKFLNKNKVAAAGKV